MIYYFSGASHEELKRELDVDQLFSAHHEKKLVRETIQYKKENNKDFRIMLDSGAFSFYMEMKKKGQVLTDKDILEYTDDYLKFLDEVGDDLECFVGVDSVPDPEHMDYTYAEKTWNNYLYMYSKLRPEIRDKLIPVFHYGEDFKWLHKYLELKHEDGSQLNYLGLAISLEGTKKVRIAWANECRRIINESSNPNVKTHAFGVGVKSVLDHIEVTSTDATSWVKRAAYGMISIRDKTIYVSDIQKDRFDKHYIESSKAYQDEVEKTIQERGFTVQELEVDNKKRAEFNIIDTKMWVEEINKEEANRRKHQSVSLW